MPHKKKKIPDLQSMVKVQIKGYCAASKITHLFVKIKPAGTFDQCVFAARKEGGQVSIHPGSDLAIQLTGLQLYAEE